jgi:glycyl-tRNA synthetase beta chain
LGILRILIEKKLDLDLVATITFAIEQFGAKVKDAGLAAQVQDFIFDRLRARYEDEGVEVAVYQAVRAVNPVSPLDFDQRVQAVQAFRKLPEADALAAANKRVSNLLSKAEGNIAPGIEAHYFDSPSEFSLNAAIQQADHAVQPLAQARLYSEALAQLAALRDPVDAFFAAVMVNAEDPSVRANRYALLAKLRSLFLGVADISLLG